MTDTIKKLRAQNAEIVEENKTLLEEIETLKKEISNTSIMVAEIQQGGRQLDADNEDLIEKLNGARAGMAKAEQEEAAQREEVIRQMAVNRQLENTLILERESKRSICLALGIVTGHGPSLEMNVK